MYSPLCKYVCIHMCIYEDVNSNNLVTLHIKHNTPSVASSKATAHMKPRMQDISNWVVPFVTDKWEKIFVQLLGDEHRGVMTILRRDHQGNSEDGCTAMFEKWLELCPNPSWDDLITALRANSVRKIALAEELFQRLGMYMYIMLYILELGICNTY